MSSSDSDEDIMIATAMVLLEKQKKLRTLKEPCKTSRLSGHEFVWELMTSHDGRFYESLRMQRRVFVNLCSVLKERKFVNDSSRMNVEEQLAIFLYTVGHNESNRAIQERFQHSGETISRVFHKVLLAILRYSIEIIKPTRSFDEIPPEIRQNKKYYPLFKDCIGAVDGCRISAVVPIQKQDLYKDKNGVYTQNIMAACSFDMLFTFVVAGWEGTANDSHVMLETLRTPRLNFPLAPPGKYYLVDAAYPNIPGFLAPYRDVRYRLQDFQPDNGAKTKEEKYNYAHSLLRNVIDRCFCVLKARFPILKQMPSYSLITQRNIVVAAMAIHNFIRQEDINDKLFAQYEDDGWIDEKASDSVDDDEFEPTDLIQPQEQQEMDQFRDKLVQMCDGWIDEKASDSVDDDEHERTDLIQPQEQPEMDQFRDTLVQMCDDAVD